MNDAAPDPHTQPDPASSESPPPSRSPAILAPVGAAVSAMSLEARVLIGLVVAAVVAVVGSVQVPLNAVGVRSDWRGVSVLSPGTYYPVPLITTVRVVPVSDLSTVVTLPDSRTSDGVPLHSVKARVRYAVRPESVVRVIAGDSAGSGALGASWVEEAATGAIDSTLRLAPISLLVLAPGDVSKLLTAPVATALQTQEPGAIEVRAVELLDVGAPPEIAAQLKQQQLDDAAAALGIMLVPRPADGDDNEAAEKSAR